MGRWCFLSYEIHNELKMYNGDMSFSSNKLRSIKDGDFTNELKLELTTHCATHIDFPAHFCDNGKNLSDYNAENFIFSKPHAVFLEKGIDSHYINAKMIGEIPQDSDILIIKTGHCNNRNGDSYWQNNIGLDASVATLLREKYPKIRAVMIDSISVNAWQNKEIGRIAHKEFLCKSPEILIIEDADLSMLIKNNLKKVIIGPLLINAADGSPCTILGEFDE